MNDKDLINGVINKFASALKNHNDSNSLNQFLSCITDPMTSDAGQMTHAGWTEAWPDCPYTDFQVNNRNITVSGTSANCTCTIHWATTDDAMNGDWIIGLTKDSGKWLINSLSGFEAASKAKLF